MKTAFTTSGDDLDAPLDPRFGRAAKFLIADLDADVIVCIANPGATEAHGAGIRAAEALVKAGVGALVTGEVGPKAAAVLKAANIKAYRCAAATVREAQAQFRAGALEETAA